MFGSCGFLLTFHEAGFPMYRTARRSTSSRVPTALIVVIPPSCVRWMRHSAFSAASVSVMPPSQVVLQQQGANLRGERPTGYQFDVLQGAAEPVHARQELGQVVGGGRDQRSVLGREVVNARKDSNHAPTHLRRRTGLVIAFAHHNRPVIEVVFGRGLVPRSRCRVLEAVADLVQSAHGLRGASETVLLGLSKSPTCARTFVSISLPKSLCRSELTARVFSAATVNSPPSIRASGGGCTNTCAFSPRIGI